MEYFRARKEEKEKEENDREALEERRERGMDDTDKWRGGGRRRIREIIHEPSAISHLVNDRGGGRDEITERLINSGKLVL